MELEIPYEFIIKSCSRCSGRHAQIRDCKGEEMSEDDIILASADTDLTWVREKFPEKHIFLVEDGPGPLQGRRIKNAYVELTCSTNPHFQDCIIQIQSSMALTKDSGNIFLF